MTFDRTAVRRLARLARLPLDPADEERSARQLGDVVAWVDRLASVEVSDEVAGDETPSERTDEPAAPRSSRPSSRPPAAGLDRETVLARAPRHRDGFVVVPSPGAGGRP